MKLQAVAFGFWIVVLASLVSSGAVVQVFGPKTYKADLKTATYSNTFNNNLNNVDGVITIQNADGKDLSQQVCPRSPLIRRLACEFENLVRHAAVFIFHPTLIEVKLNNIVVADSRKLPSGLGQIQIPIKIQKSNSLQVSVRGLRTAFLTIGIKANSTTVNQNPIAKFTMTPTSGIAPELVSFSGLLSSDPDSDPLSYSWDFADGFLATGSMVTHSFAVAGTFDVKLKVSDGRGGAHTVSQSIVIKTNQAPKANFTYLLDQNQFSGDATTSIDPDGVITNYSWSFSDGTIAQGSAVSHSFGGPGSYSVTLTVTDSKGAKAEKSASVVIKKTNQPPVAALLASTNSGNLPLTVTFDASGSVDSDNNIASYLYDFGDGEFLTSSSPSVTHVYNRSGTNLAIVTVIDSEGLQSSASTSIFVNSAPVANFSVPFDRGVAPFVVNFDASGSIDPEGQPLVEYRWSFGDGSTSSVNTSITPHTFSSVGTYSVSLSVVDSGGLTSTVQKTITVIPPPTSDISSEAELASSAGVIQITNLNSNSFSPVSSDIVLGLSLAQFSQNSHALHFSVNGVEIDQSKITTRTNQVTISGALVEGLNSLELNAIDHLGNSIFWTTNIWAGSRTVNFAITNFSSSDISTYFALAKDQDVRSIAIPGASGSIQNLPANQDLVAVSMVNGGVGLARIKPVDNLVYISIAGFAQPDINENNNFSNGTAGWQIGNGVGTVMIGKSAPYLRLSGTEGMKTRLVRTFLAGDLATHRFFYRFIPSSLSDSYTISLRTKSGSVQFSSKAASDFFSSKDGENLIQSWRGLVVETSDPQDIVQLEVEIETASAFQVQEINPIKRLFLPEIAIAAKSASMDLQYIGNNLKVEHQLFDYNTRKDDPPDLGSTRISALPKCRRDVPLKLGRLLSMGSFPSQYRGGENPICGTLDIVRKNQALNTYIDELRFEVVSQDSSSTPGDCEPQAISKSVKTGLSVAQLRDVLASGSLHYPISQIFTIPSNSMSGEQVFTTQIYIRGEQEVKDPQSGLTVRRPFCTVEPTGVDFRPIYSQRAALGGTASYRYSETRDDGSTKYDAKDFFGDQGGDDWTRFHIASAISKIVSNRPTGLQYKINDIGRMNGGEFNGHKGHDLGRGVDIKTASFGYYSEINSYHANDVISAVNLFPTDQVYVEKAHLTYSPSDGAGVKIATSCLKDGRSARSVITNIEGHTNHFHMQFNAEPLEPNMIPKVSPVDISNYDIFWAMDGSGLTHFKVKIPGAQDSTSTSNGAKFKSYKWDILDSQQSQVVWSELEGTNPTTSASLVIGNYYFARLTIFGRDLVNKNAETCVQMIKPIYIFPGVVCNGAYGKSEINGVNVSGFVDETSKILPTDETAELGLSLQVRPTVGRDSTVCSNSTLKGAVSAGLTSNFYNAKVEGNVTVFASKLDGLITSTNPGASSSFTINNVQTSGHTNIVFTNSRSYTISAANLPSAPPLSPILFSGNNTLTNPWITNGVWKISNSIIDFQNGSRLSMSADESKTRIIKDANLKLVGQIFDTSKNLSITGDVRLESTIFNGDTNISGTANISNGYFGNVVVSGTSNFSNVQTPANDVKAWILTGTLTAATCSYFSPGPPDSKGIITYFVLSPSGSPSCRSYFGNGQYSLTPQLIPGLGGN